MTNEIKQPKLNEGIKHIKKFGGYFKGRGDGRVEWQDEEIYTFDESDRLVLIDDENFAEELVEELS